MDKEKILKALDSGKIKWRKHALERMLQRGISRSKVKAALKNGEIIKTYEADVPFGSALFFYMDKKPIHVVASLDENNNTIYIITAYIPNDIYFYDDLKTRR